MNIFNTTFEKKLKKKQNEYSLKINFNVDFLNELSYKIFGKNHLIQYGILKKNNLLNNNIKIYFTSFEYLFILVKIDNSSEYFEIIDKKDFSKLLYNNKNIEINIKKKQSFDDLSTNLLTNYINNLKVNCSDSDSDNKNNINFYSDDESNNISDTDNTNDTDDINDTDNTDDSVVSDDNNIKNKNIGNNTNEYIIKDKNFENNTDDNKNNIINDSKDNKEDNKEDNKDNC